MPPAMLSGKTSQHILEYESLWFCDLRWYAQLLVVFVLMVLVLIG